MLGPEEKQRLIEQFSNCLESLEETESWDGTETSANVDLHSLLAEMAVLKNEIRLESRQFKNILDEMRTFGESLRLQNEKLNQELERAHLQLASVKQKAERGLLLDMLDLRDRLQSGLDAGTAHRPAFLSRLVPGESLFVSSMTQGLGLTLQRLDEMLSDYRVRQIEALALPMDPHTMRAVGIETVSEKPDSIVLRVTRSGFFHEGTLLRAAEVIVNKKG